MRKLKVGKSRFWREVILYKYEEKENHRRKLTNKAKSWWWKDLCYQREEGCPDIWYYKQLGVSNNILLWEINGWEINNWSYI